MSDVEERLIKMESEVDEIKEKQRKTESHLQKMRDSIEDSNSLIQDLRIVCTRIEETNRNQNEILKELKESREKDKQKMNQYTFWFLTTVLGIIITAIMTTIIK